MTRRDRFERRLAIGVPSQRTGAVFVKSAWRVRWSMLSLPRHAHQQPAGRVLSL